MTDAANPLADQARELRRMVDLHRRPARPLSGLRSLAVLSGKGGVGKSNISVNLSLAMAARGKRVVLLDADLGMANVDLLCGISPRYTLAHLVRGEKTVEELLMPISDSVLLLPGGPGVQGLADLDEASLSLLIDRLSVLDGIADVLIIDTGAGIHKNTLSFGVAADSTLLVTTPEPTAIRDAYGVLKSLAIATRSKIDVTILVNMTASEAEGREVADRVRMAASQFLELTVAYGGALPTDMAVRRAVQMRSPFLQAFPDSRASLAVGTMADSLLGVEEKERAPAGRGIKSFFFRLARGLGLR